MMAIRKGSKPDAILALTNPTKAVTNKPTHFTLETRPMETPVMASHNHQSIEKGLTNDQGKEQSAMRTSFNIYSA